MKTPLWFPQSFFARTLWLVLIVVLFSKALTLVYLLMNEDVIVDRQYSHGAALTIRAFWAADEESRAAIAKASGLRWVPSSADQPGEQHWPYTEIFQRQMQMELGPDTETRLRIHQPSQLWVRAPSLGEGWLAVPLYPHPLRGQRIWSVLGWFLGIGLLSTAAAWIFVRQLSQPLKRLVVAARQFGQGRSVRLPLGPETPSEMAEVYRAFNQMAEDIEQGGRERELMLAGVSHDLRTPLTRLRLSLELLPESEREMVEDMIRDIEDMDAILDQFLAFIRDGRDEPVEEGDLTDLVREVVAPFNQTREQVRMALATGTGDAVAACVDEASAGQPDRQCPEPRRRFGGGGQLRGRRKRGALRGAERARSRPGHRSRGSGQHLQSLHPWRQGAWRQGHRPRPGDRQAHRRPARRQRRTAQPRWRRPGSAGLPAAGVAAAARRGLIPDGFVPFQRHFPTPLALTERGAPRPYQRNRFPSSTAVFP